MATKQTIGVVIPARNEEKWLKNSLLALKNQEGFDDFEIVVVDNGSTDKTALIAQSMKVRVIAEPRAGVARARQTGFEASESEIILTTDADTIVPSNWLKNYHRLFFLNQEIIAVGGPVQYDIHDPLLKELINRTIPILHGLDCFVHQGKNHLIGANFGVKKSAFLASGGFRTDLNLGEDLDLSHRLHQYGLVLFDQTLKVITSDRRFARQGPATIWKYFQNYLETTKPDESIKRQVYELFKGYQDRLRETNQKKNRSNHGRGRSDK